MLGQCIIQTEGRQVFLIVKVKTENVHQTSGISGRANTDNRQHVGTSRVPRCKSAWSRKCRFRQIALIRLHGDVGLFVSMCACLNSEKIMLILFLPEDLAGDPGPSQSQGGSSTPSGTTSDKGAASSCSACPVVCMCSHTWLGRHGLAMFSDVWGI
jgi:hypothetical protein